MNTIIRPLIRLAKLTILAAILVATFKALPITYRFNVFDFPRTNHTLSVYYKFMEFTLDVIADSNDTVILRIDSHGGAVLSAMSLAHSVQNTDAHTHAHIVSGAISGGSVVATSADVITADRYTTILFHKARIFSMFGPPEIVDNYAVDTFLEERVQPYLTEQEYEDLIIGLDIEIPGPEFAARFNGANQ